ncbi:MAG: carbon starvation CstA family protein [Bacteroidales bacterium]|nr:carbon starvation CstA family protein [Bacteroidales bacterium]MDD3201619.1 carbon starvation CstA family protein [Bacteroidales bacterium]
MITFFISIALLLLGYFTYGKFIERMFGASSDIPTPVKSMENGADCKAIKPWRLFVIQFLNIAGLGPIFGVILGAAYGPMAYLWIVIGNILMGATHDYCAGMLSLRNKGASMPVVVKKYLGGGAQKIVLVFTAFLLLGVAVSFVVGPADLLVSLTSVNKYVWLAVIFIYYFIATILPIDEIIGNIYPFMGVVLLFMALAIFVSLIVKGFSGELFLPEVTLSSFRNMHSNPDTNILIPMMFVVISCGALSGFHSTQSPMLARCMTDEKYGRPVFYGAMICEGIVAIIWATAAISYCGGVEGLNAAADAGKTPAILVNAICRSWLGRFGAVLAMLGVIICPITSGDTALRSLRLTLADFLNIDQNKPIKRFLVAIPIFVVCALLCEFDFSTVWVYVSIINQLIATTMLWTISDYFYRKKKHYWLTLVPATFMSFICVSYIMIAPLGSGGFALNHTLSYVVGTVLSVGAAILFLCRNRKPVD